MSTMQQVFDDIDSKVDLEISSCLDLDNPKSFFLYAGAGSGKTRSLVNAVDALRKVAKNRLVFSGQRVGVITYTNAACDEIKKRIEFDPLIEVSTIHSFVWSLISGFNEDIRSWLKKNLTQEISDLTEQSKRGRPGKTAEGRQRSIDSKSRRLQQVEVAKKFIYSPTGDNRGQDALNHSEVIAITAEFLLTKPVLQQILIGRFPVIFIDESQDTNKKLMDAFLAVQSFHENRFCLGLFGDVMQRIYSDGKVQLGSVIPDSWATPKKQMNHRCPKRIVKLINRIRADSDGQQQFARSDSREGKVLLFLASTAVKSQHDVEVAAAMRMAEICGDSQWALVGEGHKTLILEHHMAARRMGFDAMFEALNKVPRFRTGLMDGTLSALRPFANDVLPVVLATRSHDPFRVMDVLRSRSPLLEPRALIAAGDDQRLQLYRAKTAVNDLNALWLKGISPSFQAVLAHLHESKLFPIPDSLAAFVPAECPATTEAFKAPGVPLETSGIEDEKKDEDENKALREFLETPFDQIENYVRYVRGNSKFDTHQGVKGLEFPRVMVVISDEEARGFIFSYDKFFGIKEKSRTDLDNEHAGNETTIDRTRRLFYVICSRAKESLIIVAYSENPDQVRAQVIERGWFDADEVELFF